MPGVQDLVATFFQVEGLKNQRRELEVLEQNSLVQRTNTMANLATLMTNPEARNAASMIVGGPQNLQDFITQAVGEVAPGVGVLERINAAAGFNALPEMDQAMLQRIAGSQAVSGMSPSGVLEESLDEALLSQPVGQEELLNLGRTRRAAVAGTTPGTMASDLTFADLPKIEQESMHRIRGGLQMSIMEENQVAQWAAQNSISWADLAQRGALGTAELAARVQMAQMQHEATMAGGAAGASASPNTLFSTITEMLEVAGDNSRSRQERAQAITIFNAAADNLSAMNLYPSGFRLDPDPDNMGESLTSAKRFLYGVRGSLAGAGAGAVAGSTMLGIGAVPGAVLGGLAGFPIGIGLGGRGNNSTGGSNVGFPGSAFSGGGAANQQEAAATLQQLISSGQITPEILQQLLQETQR